MKTIITFLLSTCALLFTACADQPPEVGRAESALTAELVDEWRDLTGCQVTPEEFWSIPEEYVDVEDVLVTGLQAVDEEDMHKAERHCGTKWKLNSTEPLLCWTCWTIVTICTPLGNSCVSIKVDVQQYDCEPFLL